MKIKTISLCRFDLIHYNMLLEFESYPDLCNNFGNPEELTMYDYNGFFYYFGEENTIFRINTSFVEDKEIIN